MQAVLQSGRQHGLLSTQGPGHRWHAVRTRHQRHLCAGPVQGERPNSRRLRFEEEPQGKKKTFQRLRPRDGARCDSVSSDY